MARKRNVPIQFYLTESEAKAFKEKVNLCGLSIGGCIRLLIKDNKPTILAPDELVRIYRKLNKIGVNINQIAYIANLTGDIDKDNLYELYRNMLEKIDELLIKM